MKKKTKNIIKYLLFFGIGIGLLVLTYYKVDLKQMAEDISKANFWWMGASFIFGYLAIVARGLRWQSMIEPMGYTAKPWNRINAVAFGYLANLGIPRSGEVARCTALNQSDDIPVDKLFGTVIVERVIDMLLLLMMIGLTFIVHYEAFSNFFDEVFKVRSQQTDEGGFPWLMVLLIFGAVCFAVVLIFRKQLKKISIFKKGYDFLDGMKDGLQSIFKLKRFWEFVGYSAMIWACYFMMTYVCFFALPITADFTPADALLLFVVSGLAMVVPAPGGTGSYHYAVTLAVIAIVTVLAGRQLTPEEYAQADTDGATFAAVVWTTQTAMVILTGVAGFVGLLIFKRKKDKALELADATD